MADINYSINVKVDKGLLTSSIYVAGVTATMGAAGLHSTIYSLSGTPTTLVTASLSAVGLAFLQNISTATATTCSIGVVSGGTVVPFSAPRPGEAAVLRLAAGSTYQATGTAGCRLRVDVTEG